MLWKKDSPHGDEELDQLGRALLRASQASDEEVESAVSSPALFERIRARATREQSLRRGKDSLNGRPFNGWSLDDWADAVGAAWRAIPALALIAIIATAFWLGFKSEPVKSGPVKSGPPKEYSKGAPAGGDIIASDPVTPVTACSVATKEECAVSTDDAVAILVSASEKEANR